MVWKRVQFRYAVHVNWPSVAELYVKRYGDYHRKGCSDESWMGSVFCRLGDIHIELRLGVVRQIVRASFWCTILDCSRYFGWRVACVLYWLCCFTEVAVTDRSAIFQPLSFGEHRVVDPVSVFLVG